MVCDPAQTECASFDIKEYLANKWLFLLYNERYYDQFDGKAKLVARPKWIATQTFSPLE